ncbi:MAG: alpha/beta hydrolase [Candidatus Pacebacteria bacterium]|nr:alpha/beta hydrolase [Candidatus Paceibacterota bacterium]
MKQVLVIHGGDSFKTYDEYLASLQAYELDDPRMPRGKGWKSLLGERLGSDYQVIAPRMPNAANARYGEWKIWFEKHIPFLDEKVILIGHSLGGCFLARYLSEEKFPKTILSTFLIAAPFGPGEDGHLTEFVPHGPFTLFEAQGGWCTYTTRRMTKSCRSQNVKSIAQHSQLQPYGSLRIRIIL